MTHLDARTSHLLADALDIAEKAKPSGFASLSGLDMDTLHDLMAYDSEEETLAREVAR